MAQVLFIAWWWPYPANNGSKIRIYNLLKQLAAAHEVTLLAFAEPDEAAADQVAHLRRFCAHVEAVPKPAYQPGSLKALLGYFSRWPRSLVDVYSPAMAAAVRQALAGGRVDVVVASELQTLRYLDQLPGTPAILETPEVLAFRDEANGGQYDLRRLRSRMTLAKLEYTLKGLLSRGVAFTVVSEAEQRAMQAFAPPGSRIIIIPNAVDADANQPDPACPPQPETLIYPGAVTYSANLDAVAYFIQEVWPRIRARAPQARFTVTGGTGSVDVRALAAQPGVTFTGYLPEVAPAVRSSWAVIVPLRIGGGTRLKILEAMALGTPVIATRKGAEGLNVHPGEDILIADTPDALAEAALQLFADADLRARLSQAGRALVEREYDWAAVGRQFLQVIEAVRKGQPHGQ